ncbi:MAG: flagellar hook-basal body complex protein [Clostridia bacterium]|jgi:flagellar basal-body rod protein FlgF|nr:flagellar hook-basal body complex protein [Clostridia bacterium]
MIRGLYTSALGLSVLNKQQEITSNNLANAQTAGYKKDVLVAESFPEMLLYRLNAPEDYGKTPPQVGSVSLGVNINQVYIDQSAGTRRSSDNPLAMSIAGEGYFTVNTPHGERYTRNGEFSMDAQGRLVTTAGYPVMGIKGEIFISGSDIQVDDQGQIYSNGTVVDRLKIVNFSTPLSKEGDTLFYGENPQIMDNPLVVHGTIEASNVQPLTEMVNMITIMRAYEANQKVIHAIDSTLDKAVNEVGRI